MRVATLRIRQAAEADGRHRVDIDFEDADAAGRLVPDPRPPVRVRDHPRSAVDLDLLRPPAFARLQQVLWAAVRAGQHCHVVHVDGHGTWANLAFGDSVAPASARAMAGTD